MSFSNSSFSPTFVATASVGLQSTTGYTHTGGFAGKPLSNQYVWQPGVGINVTQQDVDDGLFKVFSLDRDVHLAVDAPYWSSPAPQDHTDVGLFGGANLPDGVDTMFDFDYDYDTENSGITHLYYAYNSGSETGYEGSVGRIDISDSKPGDQLRCRFDFNVIPQIVNTTIEPALWYSNRNDSDQITFSFPLTAAPVFYGANTVGKTFLNRVEISAWITSTEDVNSLSLPAIKSDNPVIIQPLGMLVTILR